MSLARQEAKARSAWEIRNLIRAYEYDVRRNTRRVVELKKALELRKAIDRYERRNPGRVVRTVATPNPPRNSKPKMRSRRKVSEKRKP
jgi:hypothetical protein